MARDMKNRGFGRSYSPWSQGFPSTTQYALGSSSKGSGSSPLSGLAGAATGILGGMRKSGLTGSGRGSGGYNAALEAYKNATPTAGLTDWLDQKKALAQQAYDRSMGMLNSAFGEYMGALAANLESTKGALADSYNRSKKSIQDDAAQSLKQAYINKMMSEKNLGQQMSAQGLSGGATETTRAGMLNNYGNARNDINTTTNKNLSALEGQYNENLAAAMSAYNQASAAAQLQKAQQAIELENALANNQMAAMDDFWDMMGGDTEAFLNALGGTLDNSAFEYTPTKANNASRGINFTQSNVANQRSYNNLLQALENLAGGTRRGAEIPVNYLSTLRQMLRG